MYNSIVTVFDNLESSRTQWFIDCTCPSWENDWTKLVHYTLFFYIKFRHYKPSTNDVVVLDLIGLPMLPVFYSLPFTYEYCFHHPSSHPFRTVTSISVLLTKNTPPNLSEKTPLALLNTVSISSLLTIYLFITDWKFGVPSY